LTFQLEEDFADAETKPTFTRIVFHQTEVKQVDR